MNPLKSSFYAASLAVLMSGVVMPASAATTYSVITLDKSIYKTGSFEFRQVGTPQGIGPTGKVVGLLGLDPSILWNEQGQLVRKMGTPAETYSSAYAVNSTGEALVVGLSTHSWLWDNRTYTSYIDGAFEITVGAYGSTANALNDQLQVVGYFDTNLAWPMPSIKHAFLWSAGQYVDLGTLPGGSESVAIAVNSYGQIAGNALTASGATHAVVWRDGGIIDLGTLPGDTGSVAMNINDAGDVVGVSISGSTARPFRWSNGVMTEIGGSIDTSLLPLDATTLRGSIFRVMNNAGQIVATTNINGVNHAVVWEKGLFTDLNPILGGTGCRAASINDAGQITGICQIAGTEEAYKLTPVDSNVSVVDVGVAMSASPVSLTLGQSVTYAMTVTNSGTQTANNVNLTDILPVGVNFVSATSTQGTCNGSSSVVCALGNLATGASATVQVIVTPTVAGTLLNTASVTSSDSDVNSANNSASASVTVTAPVVSADLSVTMTDSPDPVKRRSNLTYAITVQNTGPDSASGVTLTDKLPSNMRYVSVSSSQGSCSGTATVTCKLGSIASGANAKVNIVVRPRNTGSYINSVSVSTTTQESSTTNNTATAVTTVR
jgi:uncharacterized repeat protein (TIGR01451 family)